jgi:hypothetical protein
MAPPPLPSVRLPSPKTRRTRNDEHPGTKALAANRVEIPYSYSAEHIHGRNTRIQKIELFPDIRMPPSNAMFILTGNYPLNRFHLILSYPFRGDSQNIL